MIFHFRQNPPFVSLSLSQRVASSPHTHKPNQFMSKLGCDVDVVNREIDSVLDPQFVKHIDFKTNTSPPPQIFSSTNRCCKWERQMQRHTFSSAELHPETQWHPAFCRQDKKLTYVAQLLIDGHRWKNIHVHTYNYYIGAYPVLHVTKGPSGTCPSSCLGWAVGSSRRWKWWFVAKTGFDDETSTVKQ